MGLLKTVSDRIRSFKSIENAVYHHGERVAKILNEKYSDDALEGAKPDFHGWMITVLGMLRVACDQLVAAEQKYVDEHADDVRQREKRNTDAGELVSEMIDARDAFRSIYKPTNIEEFGFPRKVGRTPRDLVRQGDHLVEILAKSVPKLPPPRFGEGLKIEEIVDPIRGKTNVLRTSITDTDRERKEAEIAQVDKDRATENYDTVLIWGAQSLEGLFGLAGEEKLAARVRPSIRRPGRTQEIANEGDEPTTEPAAEAATEAPSEAETPPEPSTD